MPPDLRRAPRRPAPWSRPAPRGRLVRHLRRMRRRAGDATPHRRLRRPRSRGPAVRRRRRRRNIPATVGRSWVPIDARHSRGNREGGESSNHTNLVPFSPRSAMVARTSSSTVPRSSPITAAPGTRRLEAHQVHQLFGGHPDVGPPVGGMPRGDPPDPEQSHDVVDADRRGVAKVGAQCVHDGDVGRRAQRGGVERDEPPVLTRRVERVGRRAEVHAPGDERLVQPRIRAGRVDADGEIGHQSGAVRRPWRAVPRSSTASRRGTPRRRRGRGAWAATAGSPGRCSSTGQSGHAAPMVSTRTSWCANASRPGPFAARQRSKSSRARSASPFHAACSRGLRSAHARSRSRCSVGGREGTGRAPALRCRSAAGRARPEMTVSTGSAVGGSAEAARAAG